MTPDDRDDLDRLDRFKSIRTIGPIVNNCKKIQWKPLSHDGDDRSDPNVSQNAPVIPRFNTLSVRDEVDTKLLHECMVLQAAIFPNKTQNTYIYIRTILS